MFNFFGLKKKPLIEDVEAKVPTPEGKHTSMSFNDALSAQAAAEAAAKVEVTPEVVAPVAPAPVDIETAPPTTVAVEQLANAAPAVEPGVLGQMNTMKSTREDVIAAYKIFLGRIPESMEVVDPRVGLAPVSLLVDFLASKEFLDQAPKSQLVLAVAKKILDERKQAAAAEGVTPSSETTAPVENTQSAK
jgi:hypothetical protein